MKSRPSLEELLQALVNTPEAEKGALVNSLVRSLRESCNLFNQSSSAKDRETARSIRNILNNILESVEESEEWEEEFVESNDNIDVQKNKSETFTSSQSQALLEIDEDPSTPTGQINQLVNAWNRSMLPWMRLPRIDLIKTEDATRFVYAASSLRSNFCSAGTDEHGYIPKFDEMWKQFVTIFEEAGYSFAQQEFGKLEEATPKAIYTCRGKITETDISLIVPEMRHNGELLTEAVSSVVHPSEVAFPEDHPYHDLPSHWRGICGELDLLAQHVSMQEDIYSAIEGINKNRVEPISEARELVGNEIRRRGEALRRAIAKAEDNPYHLATDYWRVEECFWSIFHDDDRIAGYSFFDRSRNHLQAWRTTLRRILKFHIRDFSCGNDTLASVNKYIGNIILQRKRSIAPGTVIRELRPAILVKVQATSRVLKGRVIAT